MQFWVRVPRSEIAWYGFCDPSYSDSMSSGPIFSYMDSLNLSSTDQSSSHVPLWPEFPWPANSAQDDAKQAMATYFWFVGAPRSVPERLHSKSINQSNTSWNRLVEHKTVPYTGRKFILRVAHHFLVDFTPESSRNQYRAHPKTFIGWSCDFQFWNCCGTQTFRTCNSLQMGLECSRMMRGFQIWSQNLNWIACDPLFG